MDKSNIVISGAKILDSDGKMKYYLSILDGYNSFPIAGYSDNVDAIFIDEVGFVQVNSVQELHSI